MPFYGLALLLAFLLNVVGCESLPTAVPPPRAYPVYKSPPAKSADDVGERLTDEQKIALLRQEAHRRHLKWRIFCTDWMSDREWKFQGWAVQHDAPFEVYVEDGGRDDWGDHGPTQAETALRLYYEIQKPPHPAPHRPEKSTTGKQCPMELRGE